MQEMIREADKSGMGRVDYEAFKAIVTEVCAYIGFVLTRGSELLSWHASAVFEEHVVVYRCASQWRENGEDS